MAYRGQTWYTAESVLNIQVKSRSSTLYKPKQYSLICTLSGYHWSTGFFFLQNTVDWGYTSIGILSLQLIG